MSMSITVAEPWVQDGDYIINLTKHVVGVRLLRAHRERDKGADAHKLYEQLHLLIQQKAYEMSNETLGRICAYGTPHGAHLPGEKIPGARFRHQTGFVHLPAPNFYMHSFNGHGLLARVATQVIVCVARDLILQDQWQREAGVESPPSYL
ncbi:MAG: hypothetical protein AB199_01900 [Parcubacteria bacterium C7867-004]|nr:MAG: hypothetical protein AB199_01900 [Parcubacteria bacterium C7867-004]